MKSKIINATLIVLFAGAAYILIFSGSDPASNFGKNINIPALSPRAQEGEVLFNANCSSCHGTNATGTDQGPPLIHNIYNPGHHGDQAFFMAANRGTKQHHWQFGDMPPQKQVKANDVIKIVKYIREVQEANGIVFKEHRM